MRHQRRDVGGPGLEVHHKDRDQQQDRAEKRVEEELERRVDASVAAPYADDQEHRDQAALEEKVEHDEVERAEDADHHRLHDQEGDHVLAHPGRDRIPAGENTNRRQQRGQDDEQHRNPIDADVVANGLVDPHRTLDELEVGGTRVERSPQPERQREIDQRGPKRHPAAISRRQLGVIARRQQRENRAQQRQEYQQRQDRPRTHRSAPKPVKIP